MVVGSFIENIKTKIFIKFHFINFMIYLARVANSMVIFSASYAQTAKKKNLKSRKEVCIEKLANGYGAAEKRLNIKAGHAVTTAASRRAGTVI